jgi:hypothetical protein
MFTSVKMQSIPVSTGGNADSATIARLTDIGVVLPPPSILGSGSNVSPPLPPIPTPRQNTSQVSRVAVVPVSSVGDSRREAVPLRLERQGSSPVVSPPVWRPPSMFHASEYMNSNHPRDEGGKPFRVWKTSTGRYCSTHWCSRKCDPFQEGSNSDLDSFGPGITNYFKFLKWVGYMFFFWVVYSIPALLVNSSGTGIDISLDPFNRLAVTTIGNLGQVCTSKACSLNMTAVVLFPGCKDPTDDPFVYGVYSCTIDRKELALVYSILDVAGIATAFAMYLYLRILERRTPTLLSNRGRTAADYTVQIFNLPQRTRADRLREHMEVVTGCKVVDVQIVEARTLSRLFHCFRERGKLLDQKLRLDNVVLKLRYKKDQWESKRKAEWRHNSKLCKAEEARKILLDQIQELKSKRADLKEVEGAPTAFVTFEY